MKLSLLLSRALDAVEASPWLDTDIDTSTHVAQPGSPGKRAETVADALNNARLGCYPVSGQLGLSPGGNERWDIARAHQADTYPLVDPVLLEILARIDDPALCLPGEIRMNSYAGVYDNITPDAWFARATEQGAGGVSWGH